MASSISQPVNIKPFDGTGFDNWFYRVKSMLERNKVLSVISESSPSGTGKQIEAWHDRDSKAKDLIVQCLADNVLEIVKSKSTAKSMIETLSAIYEQKGLLSRVQIQKKLRNMTFTGRSQLNDFLIEFDKLVTDLRAAGGQMDKGEYVTQLLTSMPDTYQSVVTSLDVLSSADANLVTEDFVKNKLLAEEERMKITGGNGNVPDHGNAFLGYGRRPTRYFNNSPNFRNNSYDGSHFGFGNKQSQSKQQFDRPSGSSTTDANFRGKCGLCGIRGHKRAQCPNRKGPVRNVPATQNFRGASAANISCIENEEEEEIVFLSSEETAIKSQKDFQCFSPEIVWVVDSGCSHSLAKTEFENFLLDSHVISRKINVAKVGQSVKARRSGVLPLMTLDNKPLSVQQVHICDDLVHNLLSVKQIEEKGFHVVFANGTVKIMKGDKVIIKGERQGNLYCIKMKVRLSPEANFVQDNPMLWHRRMGHSAKFPADGICEVCIVAKQTRSPFLQSIPVEKKAKRILEWISSDVCGPISPSTYDGMSYFVTFIDHFSHFTTVYLLKKKSEVDSYFRKYVNMVEAKHGKRVANLRCDNGGEYSSTCFKDFCAERGITIHYNVARNSQQNGIAEKYNRDVMDIARSLVHDSKVSRELWGEAVLAAAYLKNRTGTSTLEKGVTPAEVWYGYKPDLSRIRVFGCTAYIHIPPEDRNSKLDPRSRRMIFTGYCSNGYRVWDPVKRKITSARSVIFEEEPPVVTKVEVGKESFPSHSQEKDVEALPGDEPVLRRSQRERRRPKRDEDYEMMLALSAGCLPSDIPRTYQEAADIDLSWKQAADKELNSLIENHTWDYVEPPSGVPIVETRWVFTEKTVEGVPHKRARLVAKGYQQPYLDEENSYSPVARLVTL
ncbi:unnamed protein product, partial [Nesidiocoris tenuis]